jgi:O-antigen/teichoic acid export membrane protein
MNVGDKVITALRWSAAAKLTGSLLSWAMTIFVIRLLSPSDYGVLAMAIILPSVLYLLNDLGLDVVLVQRRVSDPVLGRQVFGVVIVLNLLCVGILIAGAPLVASFFGEATVIPVMRLLSLQFIMVIFDTLPRAKLEQRLDFRGQSIISVIAIWLGGLVTLILAWMGLGVWSLVWGRLVSTAATTIGLNTLAPSFPWPIFSLEALRHSFSFGGFVTIERTAWQLLNDADKVIGGRLWSETVLGLYTVAQDLATMPMHRTGGLIASIGLPAFSQLQGRLDEVRFYLLKAVRITSAVSFPVFIGLALTSSEAVALLLGPQWLASAPVLRILALVMPFRMATSLLPPVLWGLARPGVSATNVLIAAVVIPGACLIGGQWGPVGMAAAWLAGYPVVWVVTLHRSGAAMGLTVRDFLHAMKGPALAALAMVVAVSGARSLLAAAGTGPTLAVLIPVGVLTYGGVIALLDRSSLRETLLLLTR